MFPSRFLPPLLSFTRLWLPDLLTLLYTHLLPLAPPSCALLTAPPLPCSPASLFPPSASPSGAGQAPLPSRMLRKLPIKGLKGDGKIVPGVVVLVELMPGDDEVMPGEMSPVGSHVALVALADAK